MPWRAGRILFILWQAVWLNAVIPGHTRGAIPLPGSAPADESPAPGCCAGATDREGESRPSPADRARCAVCYFAAGLILAAPPDLAPAPKGLCEVLPPAAPGDVPSLPLAPTYDGRGPPLIQPFQG